ncbi:uncharacterized protein [Mytilus edulis]|uniref:uncharacterized protein n=1 Tax=Mytilus edulis TaxID=6550 RepID=UPI0039EFD715
MPLTEEKVGKRKPKPTERSKLSFEQDGTFSPKKKKVADDTNSLTTNKKPVAPKSKKTSQPKKPPMPNLKADEKKVENETNLQSELEMSKMLDQLFPPASPVIENSGNIIKEIEKGTSTSLSETWSLCTQASAHEIDSVEDKKIPVPSSAVMSFFKLLIKPEVVNYMKQVVEHFDSSLCSHENNECYEVVSELNDSLRETTYHITNLDKENIEETTDGLLSIIPPSSTVSIPGQCFNTTPKPYELGPTNTVITPDTTRTYLQNPTNNQQIPSSTCSSADKQTFTPRRSPRKSPRKSLSQEYRESPGPSSEALDSHDTLLKLYPDVKIKPDKLSSAISATRKSNKPGYALCYNLIAGVFGSQELANSRGQGLTKAKEGDIRPVLDKNKCTAIKEYTLRWCKKNQKILPTEAERNNSFTEQVSHCRKRIKKQMQKH